jgi:hypothetical protein
VEERIPQPVSGGLAKQTAKSPKFEFYPKLNRTLEGFEFGRRVRAFCAPASDQSGPDERAPRAFKETQTIWHVLESCGARRATKATPMTD